MVAAEVYREAHSGQQRPQLLRCDPVLRVFGLVVHVKSEAVAFQIIVVAAVPAFVRGTYIVAADRPGEVLLSVYFGLVMIEAVGGAAGAIRRVNSEHKEKLLSYLFTI
jgi:hypothetical protein